VCSGAPMSGSTVAIPVALAAKLPGKHEPGLGSSRPHLGSPQVLLDAAQLALALGLCP
jgi:hypothetical protein